MPPPHHITHNPQALTHALAALLDEDATSNNRHRSSSRRRSIHRTDACVACPTVRTRPAVLGTHAAPWMLQPRALLLSLLLSLLLLLLSSRPTEAMLFKVRQKEATRLDRSNMIRRHTRTPPHVTGHRQPVAGLHVQRAGCVVTLSGRMYLIEPHAFPPLAFMDHNDTARSRRSPTCFMPNRPPKVQGATDPFLPTQPNPSPPDTMSPQACSSTFWTRATRRAATSSTSGATLTRRTWRWTCTGRCVA